MRTTILSLTFLFFSIMKSEAQSHTDNQLTAQEKNEGWQLLFDGQSLDHWRFYQNQESSDWVVENGTIHCVSGSGGTGKHSDLITKEQYENFELSIDWKLAPKGNSGIIYMVSEQYKQPYLSGPEYQLLDDPSYAGQIEPYQQTGSNYAMNAPTVLATNPIGEWNQTRIVVHNGHVEHWLNGKKVVTYELGSEEWKANKQKGKWKDAEGYGMTRKGHIDLQDHPGSEVWFKNIKIRTL